ncbi:MULTISPECIES: hypothetical protein [Methylobacterium]|uniref:Uncharacterized protein n=3 Tax=Pseudomonadota TaxID=1224 RepID=A0ABQ4SW22_9HYPH|nr:MULTISPECIES: hypothetical protein [Methylobacterium]PIU06289.1 MAG: hypothetical protein COT56_10755 [Methylobacterium sp. CG09_land_8_20_14_0_10_71_15]PIU11160.1 MAG: hypothetical protein COT28_21340 [Methylobacterium sp. CG08_land_8_20_14_0_20_71_15]GJE06724.1 hypothetical protein AOPFMNJM_2046 [Methylobacterium jeotgali]
MGRAAPHEVITSAVERTFHADGRPRARVCLTVRDNETDRTGWSIWIAVEGDGDRVESLARQELRRMGDMDIATGPAKPPRSKRAPKYWQVY